jgi:hypothetical protein
VKHPEDQIHKAVVAHLRLRADPAVVYFHPANGGRRDIREASKLKAFGVRPGVSDLILIRDGLPYALELKAPGGRPTEHQLKFLSDFNEAGGYSACAEGLDRALAVLDSWQMFQKVKS